MAVFRIMGCEIEKEDIIKGAFIVTGIATIAVGIKKFFDAKDLSYELEDLDEDDPEMDEFYLEEYKDQERTRISRKMGFKIGTGVVSVIGGIAALGIGILSFTPYRKLVTDRFDDIDISDLKNRISNSELRQKIAEADLRQKISDIDLRQKLADIDVKNYIPEVSLKEKLAEADLRQKLQNANIIQKLTDADIKKLAAEMLIKSKIKDMKKITVISKIKDLIG